MICRLLSAEPVRLYGIVAAAVPLVAYFVPSGAWPLVLPLIAVVLGVGEAARSRVWSPASHELVMEQLMTVTSTVPDPLVGNLLPADDDG